MSQRAPLSYALGTIQVHALDIAVTEDRSSIGPTLLPTRSYTLAAIRLFALALLLLWCKELCPSTLPTLLPTRSYALAVIRLYALAKLFTYCAKSCVHTRRCFISTPAPSLVLSYFTVTVFYSGEPDYKPISIELIRFHYAATLPLSLISTTLPRLTPKLSRPEKRPTTKLREKARIADVSNALFRLGCSVMLN